MYMHMHVLCVFFLCVHRVVKAGELQLKVLQEAVEQQLAIIGNLDEKVRTYISMQSTSTCIRYVHCSYLTYVHMYLRIYVHTV